MEIRFIGPAAQSGFSLIEMLVVLVLLAILGFSMSAGLDTHASVVVEADILRSHLGYAQSLAMANNTAAWSVTFAGNSYTLARDPPPPAPGHVPYWPNETSATYLLPAGISILSGLGPVDLNEWGAPAATHVVLLSDGSQSRSVSITGFTGLVP